LGLGSNLGQRAENLTQALCMLEDELKIVRTSSGIRICGAGGDQGATSVSEFGLRR